jgi:hypothetical protein
MLRIVVMAGIIWGLMRMLSGMLGCYWGLMRMLSGMAGDMIAVKAEGMLGRIWEDNGGWNAKLLFKKLKTGISRYPLCGQH